jgi:hypothetical protein
MQVARSPLVTAYAHVPRRSSFHDVVYRIFLELLSWSAQQLDSAQSVLDENYAAYTIRKRFAIRKGNTPVAVAIAHQHDEH